LLSAIHDNIYTAIHVGVAFLLGPSMDLFGGSQQHLNTDKAWNLSISLNLGDLRTIDRSTRLGIIPIPSSE
ncbi:hypothetical protein U1Q18_049686, partial [Sarracenia purpurea var. burkii]